MEEKLLDEQVELIDIDENDVQTNFNFAPEEAYKDEGPIKSDKAFASYTPFTVRTKKPARADKYNRLYRVKGNGGLSYCILGKPKDSECDVLSNCVGYACGRFNEIYNEITGYTGIKYPLLCNDAEVFISYDVNKRHPELKPYVTNKPLPGSIGVMEGKGSLAGHVFIVEKGGLDVDSIYISEACYNGTAFRNRTLTKTKAWDGTVGWGNNDHLKFLGFINNPAVKVEEDEVLEVSRNELVDQLRAKGNTLRIREYPNLSGKIHGFTKTNAYYNFYETHKEDGYTWYRIGTKYWCADCGSIEILKVKPKTYPVNIESNEHAVIEVDKHEACEGDIVYYNVKLESGYVLNDVTLDGVILIDKHFTMPAKEVKLAASVELKNYIISTEECAHGTVSVDKEYAYKGDIVNITYSADSHYKLKNLYVNKQIIEGTTYTVKDSDVVVSAEFELIVQPKFKIGDRVKILAVGNGQPDGSGTTRFQIGNVENVTQIVWKEEYVLEEYCYQLSAWNGTVIGYYREEDIELEETQPKQKFMVGDKIKILGKGNSKADGSGYTTYGISWKKEVLDYQEGAMYPYLIGKNDIIQGWYRESELQLV